MAKKIDRRKGKKPEISKRMMGNQRSVGNRGGRPIEWTDSEIAKETEALHKWIADPKNYFFTSFLNERNLDPKQVQRFCEYDPEFCQAFERAKQIQEQRLVEGALNRKFDPGFTKFVLQNKSGWKEKSEVSGDANNPLAVIMAKIADNAKDPLEEYDG